MTATTQATTEINAAVRAGDVTYNDIDRASRLGMLRGLDTSALVMRIDAYHAFLTAKSHRAQYPIGSARRHICAKYLIEAVDHFLHERFTSDEKTQDYYMEVLAVAHTEMAKNLRAQIKSNQAGR